VAGLRGGRGEERRGREREGRDGKKNRKIRVLDNVSHGSTVILGDSM